MTADPPDAPMVVAQERARQWATDYHQQLRRAAQDAGGRLAFDDGTEVANSVKSIASLQDKADRVSAGTGTVDETLLEVNDLNRYTVVFDDQDYTAGVERARELLSERGLAFDPERSSNRWNDPFYKGYHATFRDPGRPHAALDPARAGPDDPRHPVEVQFHTPDSLAAKQNTRDLYQLIRSGELDDEAAAAAMELQARSNERVGAPPGSERLEPHRDARDRPPAGEIPPEAFARVRDKAAALQAAREAQRQDPSRAPPGPGGAGLYGSGPPPGLPAEQRRRLTPERSRAGRREDWRDPHRRGPERGPERS